MTEGESGITEEAPTNVILGLDPRIHGVPGCPIKSDMTEEAPTNVILGLDPRIHVLCALFISGVSR